MKNTASTCISLIAIVILSTTLASMAQDAIGSVIAIEGKITAKAPAGKQRALRLKAEIYQNDKIISAQSSKVQIMFNDNSIISQGENAEMIIDEYVYSPENTEDASCGMQFVKGVFRVVTGKITDLNPDRFKVKTRMATIGIRGCEVACTIRQASESIYILGLPSGKSIMIEQTQVNGNILKKGTASKKQILEILKPGVVVHLQAGKSMKRKRISVSEARNIVGQSTVSGPPQQEDNDNRPAGPRQPGEDEDRQPAPGDRPPHQPGDENAPPPPGGHHMADDQPFDPNDPEFEHRPLDGDPDRPFDPDGPFDPEMAAFDYDPADGDPDVPFEMWDAWHDVHMETMQQNVSDDLVMVHPQEYETDGEGMFDDKGNFVPGFDPDNPDTWPPDPNFNPDDPSTWPDLFFYHPEFDPDNPDTWPEDPYFNPDDPSTWPQPPLYDPNDPNTWPDDPNFDPDDPSTWPPPPDEGGPADDLPAGSEFFVLGVSQRWEWGYWEQDGELLTADVFPIFSPIVLIKGADYASIVGGPPITLTTSVSPNILAAVFQRAGFGKKLMDGGTANITLNVGNSVAGTWGGSFNIGTGPADNMSFSIPVPSIVGDPGGIVDANGNLVLEPGTMPSDLGFTAQVYGLSVSDADVTSYSINGELLGTTGPPTIEAVIGWLLFEDGATWKISGAFASDLN